MIHGYKKDQRNQSLIFLLLISLLVVLGWVGTFGDGRHCVNSDQSHDHGQNPNHCVVGRHAFELTGNVGLNLTEDQCPDPGHNVS